MNNSLFIYEDNYKESSNDCIVELSPCGTYARLNELIGEGACKIVYKALNIVTMTEVAYNIISTRNKNKEDKIRINNEIQILKNIRHPNIINIIDCWYNKEKNEVVFTMPLLSYNLKNFIKKYYIYINIEHKFKWIRQIIDGISYLHSQNIIHRDLKLDNIFINSDTGNILLADFGLSKKITSKTKASSCIGTPEYMAPEIYSGDYDKCVDIYAFGMCLLALFTNEEPYSECNNIMQIYKKVINKIPPKSLEKLENIKIKDIADNLDKPWDLKYMNHNINNY